MITKRALLMAALASAMAAGCGNSGPMLVGVNGTVTHNGKPVDGAEVTFVPADSNTAGLPGNGITGPSGDYRARTADREGLVPGKYQVTVKKVTVNAPASPAGAPKEDPRMILELEQAYALSVAQKTGKTPPLPSFIEKIDDTFEREVPPEGGVIDLVIKSHSPNAPVAKK